MWNRRLRPQPVDLMAPDERLAHLCRRIRASDRDAFAEAFAELRPGLLRFASARVRDANVAHDLVQDVFLALWESRRTLDPEQSLKALTFRMVRNRAYNHLRGLRVRQRHAPALAAEPRENGMPLVEARDLLDHVHEWIAALPDRQREALELTRFAGLSHREAAEAMQISPRTLNNHLVRALSALNRRRTALESEAD